MAIREGITFRKSPFTTIISLLFILPLFFLGAYSVSLGQFIIPALIFLILLLSLTFTILYSGFATLSLSSAGISQRTIFQSWTFDWKEIECWTVRQYPDDNSDLMFSTGLPRSIQISRGAVNSKERLEVKEWFYKYVGRPLDYDEFVARTADKNAIAS